MFQICKRIKLYSGSYTFRSENNGRDLSVRKEGQRQTDKTKLQVAFDTFANAPQKEGRQKGHTERIFKDKRMKKRRYEKKSF